MSWIEVGNVDDIPVLGARVVRTPSGDIGVFRNAEDEIFAVNDRCPHKGGPLSQGIMFGRHIACPLHNWVIELDSGNARAPDVGCVSVHETKIENGKIFLSLSVEADQVQGFSTAAQG